MQLLAFVVEVHAQNSGNSSHSNIGPMRYQHTCKLVAGESPWRTFHFAPSVDPKTVELATMFAFLIADWAEPERWSVPHHSLKVHFYPVNDFMVSTVDISGLGLDEQTSFIGEFADLKGALAFVIFVSGTKQVILRYQYEAVDSTQEPVREAIYECEHPNPKFNPLMWVENHRFGDTVQNLLKRVRSSSLEQ